MFDLIHRLGTLEACGRFMPPATELLSYFDDIDILTKEREVPKPLDEIEKEPVEIDELLEDDNSEETFDDNEINTISYPIKIADDDSAGTDEEE